jgi:hypothetical protein
MLLLKHTGHRMSIDCRTCEREPVAILQERRILEAFLGPKHTQNEVCCLSQARVTSLAASVVDLAKLEAIFYLQPSYFGAMMTEIGECHGSFDTYLEDGLGEGPSDRDHLEALLTL